MKQDTITLMNQITIIICCIIVILGGLGYLSITSGGIPYTYCEEPDCGIDYSTIIALMGENQTLYHNELQNLEDKNGK